MTTAPVKRSEVSIDAFIAAASDTNASAIRAGQILAALVDSNPAVYDEIRKRVPTFTISALQTFEKIGRRKIHVPLLFDASPAAHRLIHCPYEQQVRYSSEPVPVVVRLTDGRAAIERKPLDRAPASVFGDRGVKTADQQLAERFDSRQQPEQSTKAVQVEHVQRRERYTILDDGSITFHEPGTFTAAQIEAIAERCRSRAISSLVTK